MRDYFVKVSKETESKTYRVLYRQDKVPDDDFITHQTTFFVILGQDDQNILSQNNVH